MEVFINNQKTNIADKAISLKELCPIMHIPVTGLGIAIAVNDNIIPKTKWQNTIINDQDKILIIKATQGG